MQLPPTLQIPAERVVTTPLRAAARVRGALRDDEDTLRPGFVLLGGQRCGTTSIYSYLTAHPRIAPALTKEVHYFDNHATLPLDWYWGHFPARTSVPAGTVTGEASPYYLLHPGVPARLAAALPDVPLLVLLRDPVERALSHHRHETAKGHETLSFADAVAAEEERLGDDMDRLAQDPSFRSHAVQHHSYVLRGHYADQLERWEAAVGRDRLHVWTSEQLFEDPARVTNDVLDLLGLPPQELPEYKVRNAYARSPMDEGLRRELADRFAPSTARLGRWLGDATEAWTT